MSKLYKDKFKDLENFATDSYMRNLAKLNKELRDLEQRAAKGQQELESRIEGVNRRYNLVLPASYMDALNKKLGGINFLASKQDIDERLGGEFDYNEFQADLDKIALDFKSDKDMYYLNLRETEVNIPDKPSKADREYFEKIQNEPSILDVLKKKIKDLKFKLEPAASAQEEESKGQQLQAGVKPQVKPLHPSQPEVRPSNLTFQKQQQPAMAATIFKPPKTSNLYSKPEHLRKIQTTPLPCPVDLRFRKLNPDANDFETYFDEPNPIDIAQINRRVKEPYDEQLRKEFEATRDFDRKPLPRIDQTQRKEGLQNDLQPPTSEDPTARYRQANLHPQPDSRMEPSQTYSGLNTQELVDRPVRKPSSHSDSRKDEIEFAEADEGKKKVYIEDMLGRQPRDTMTFDDFGTRHLDEDLLKDRIRANLGSMKNYFRTDASFRPFEGLQYSDDQPLNRLPQNQANQGKDTDRSKIGLPESAGGEHPSRLQNNEEIVKQITDNFACLLNDIMAGIKANHPVPQPSNLQGLYSPLPQGQPLLAPTSRYDLPEKPMQHSIQGAGSDRQASQKGPLNLDGYYQTLNSFYNGRSSHHREPSPQPQLTAGGTPLLGPKMPDLQSYVNHLESSRPTEEARPAGRVKDRQSEMSLSEGEIGLEGFKHAGREHREEKSEDEGRRDKSEGELSDIGHRIFFD